MQALHSIGDIFSRKNTAAMMATITTLSLPIGATWPRLPILRARVRTNVAESEFAFSLTGRATCDG